MTFKPFTTKELERVARKANEDQMKEVKKGASFRLGYQMGIKEERERMESWVKRLKHYTDIIRDTQDNKIENRVAVIALLGYLESAEYLIKNQ